MVSLRRSYSISTQYILIERNMNVSSHILLHIDVFRVYTLYQYTSYPPPHVK